MLTLEKLQSGLVIPIDKPLQWTSFQAVNKVKSTIRRLYGIKNIKIGHAGTLDPLATGLILVCVGKATKTIELLQSGEKEYTGTFLLGATTPCYDLEQPINQYFDTSHITNSLLRETIHNFIGEIKQVPPMYSAIKVDGQRAYRYARNDDQSVVINPKKVTVKNFEIGNIYQSYKPVIKSNVAATTNTTRHLYKNPLGVIPEGMPLVDFRIVCSKGTYIRSIARDLGEALSCGACLASLRRERVGTYTVSSAVQLDLIEDFFKNEIE